MTIPVPRTCEITRSGVTQFPPVQDVHDWAILGVRGSGGDSVFPRKFSQCYAQVPAYGNASATRNHNNIDDCSTNCTLNIHQTANYTDELIAAYISRNSALKRIRIDCLCSRE